MIALAALPFAKIATGGCGSQKKSQRRMPFAKPSGRIGCMAHTGCTRFFLKTRAEILLRAH